ncbi:MAG: hypothetical protein FJY36_03180 [Betaproteobacteria bacterium]|nr:hypothetical protein [Betaproteobacteria bacterium]
MGIHQLSVHHDERQDRLLLRLNTQAGEEFRFWLTRRMAARLLPAIEQAIATLESQRSGMLGADAPARQMLTEMQREAFVQQADFNTPFSAAPNALLPLGELPLLVTDVQLSVLPQALLQLVLQDHSQPQGRHCQLQLPAQLVHGLLHLSRQAVFKAEWGLGADTTAPLDPAEPVASPETRYAH